MVPGFNQVSGEKIICILTDSMGVAKRTITELACKAKTDRPVVLTEKQIFSDLFETYPSHKRFIILQLTFLSSVFSQAF